MSASAYSTTSGSMIGHAKMPLTSEEILGFKSFSAARTYETSS